MDPKEIAMNEFIRRSTEEALKKESCKIGFMLAFLDATGLQPEQCEMVVSEMERTDPVTGSRAFVQKIWFQKRGT